MPDSILILRSNPIAPDPRVEKVACALVSAGYRVSVLGWDRGGLLPSEEQKDGFQIQRLPIKAGFGRGLENLPQLIRWQIGMTTWLIRHHQAFDAIHACDFDTILPALLCKLSWHRKVVYDIFDFYADHLRKTPTLIKRLIRAIDYKAIRYADAVIIVDDSRRQQIAGSRPRRLEVIYNSPEDKALEIVSSDDVSATHLREQLSTDNQKFPLHLVYVGLLQVERGLFEVLDVLSHHPEWSLDLAGFGGDEQAIVAKAKGMANVTWHGRIPYKQALQLSFSADVLFATYDPKIPNHRYASPNKVFEAMMLGRPILVACNTNMDEIITRADCGIVIEYGNLGDLEVALQKLASNPDLRSKLGANGRIAYESQYSWKIMRDRLVDVYRQLNLGGNEGK